MTFEFYQLQKNAFHVVNSLIRLWISKFGTPWKVITDKRTVYLNSGTVNDCIMCIIRHSPPINCLKALHITSLLYHLILITNPLIQLCCFIAVWWNQFLLGVLLSKQKCCKFTQKYIKMHWKKIIFSCLYDSRPTIFLNRYHWFHLFHIEFFALFKFWQTGTFL